MIDLTGSTGGVAPFTYSNNGGGSFQASGVFNGLGANTYNTVVMDANGCQVTGSEFIGGGSAMTLASSQVDETCTGANGTATVTPTGTGPFTYSWSSGGTTDTETGLGARKCLAIIGKTHVRHSKLIIVLLNTKEKIAICRDILT